MKDTTFVYTVPAMDAVDMIADGDCSCCCGLFVGGGSGSQVVKG